MNTLYYYAIFGSASLLMACQSPAVKKNITSTADTIMQQRLKPGQIWKYHNRKEEDSSTCTILKIEKYEAKQADLTLVHIRVDGVRISSPGSPGGYISSVQHFPCSEECILSSVTEMVGTTPTLPEFSEGYKTWKEAWDAGEAGYFTAPLKDILEGIEQGIRK